MASDEKFVWYVRDQMRGAGNITSRRMFGEYAVYCDDKVIGFVCDNQLFVKPTADGRALLGSVVEAAPYPEAKPYFLIADELEDAELLCALVRVTARALPAPKSKAPAKRKVPATRKVPAKRKAAAKAQKGKGARSGPTQPRRAATDKRRSRDQ